MKNIRKILLAFIVSCLIVGGAAYSQPVSLKKDISSKISPKIRKQIERLYSSYPEHRIRAIRNLGRMRPKAVSAIPYLIELLADEGRIGLDVLRIFKFDLPGFFSNSVHKEAARALVFIGKPAVKLLIKALLSENSKVQDQAEFILKKITRKNFGKDAAKWRQWRYKTNP